MSTALAAGLGLGALLGLGLWLIVLAQPVGWRPSLEQRLEPQLRHHVPASRLLETEAAATSPWGAWGRLLGPPLTAMTRVVQSLGPAGETLSRRLEAAGSPLTAADYRAQQVLWACLGVAVGTATALALAVSGAVPAFTAVALVVAAGLGGYVLRDQALGWTITRRRTAILTEFPSVAELFALSVLSLIHI